MSVPHSPLCGSGSRDAHSAPRIASLRSPFGQPAAGYLRFASVVRTTLLPHSKIPSLHEHTTHPPQFPPQQFRLHRAAVS